MESASKMLALFSCPKEVSITPYLSKEQIAAAREMDLLTYLRRFEPEELVHIGGDTYATRTHDSLKISNGKWCWWSRVIQFILRFVIGEFICKGFVIFLLSFNVLRMSV